MVEYNEGIHIKGPAKFVPAAAVKRRGRVLFNVTGRKSTKLDYLILLLKTQGELVDKSLEQYSCGLFEGNPHFM